jgi:hypothetical protein
MSSVCPFCTVQEFYVREYPQFTGQTFDFVRHHFPDACVAGIIMASNNPTAAAGAKSAEGRGSSKLLAAGGATGAGLVDGKATKAAAAAAAVGRGSSGFEAPSSVQLLELAPSDDRVLQPGESLVLVASDAASMTPAAQPFQVGH